MPDRPFNPFLFRLYASDLSEAIYDLSRETQQMSITGFEPGAIQAKLASIKQKASERRAQSMAKLEDADAKLASVDSAIEQYAAQIEKEAADALQEFATHTNGGPVLDSTEGTKPGYPTYP